MSILVPFVAKPAKQCGAIGRRRQCIGMCNAYTWFTSPVDLISTRINLSRHKSIFICLINFIVFSFQISRKKMSKIDNGKKWPT